MCVLVCVCLMGALFVVAGVMVYGVSRVCLRLCVVSVCACCLCDDVLLFLCVALFLCAPVCVMVVPACVSVFVCACL